MARPQGARPPKMATRDHHELARAITRGALGVPAMEVQRDAAIAPFTSLKVGGPARLLVRTRDAVSTIAIAEAATLHQVPILAIGGGSNVVVADAGFDGLVIKLDPPTVARHTGTIAGGVRDEILVDVEAGCQTAGLARWAAREGLAGIEWACGIPGTIGGAIAGNAGAYGGDMAGVVETVRAWLGPHETGSPAENGPEPWARMTEIPVADMGYAYRTSRLKRGHGVVLGARLRLRRERPDVILARIDSFEAARRQKQPTERSCGSIFRNPPGEVAGRLLEDAGMKGRSRGDAQVSPIHANWIINRGTASAMDVAWLMKQGQTEVLARAGIQLHLEVLLVGEWDPAVVDALVEAPTACPTTGNSGLPPLPPLPTREGGFTAAIPEAHAVRAPSHAAPGAGTEEALR